MRLTRSVFLSAQAQSPPSAPRSPFLLRAPCTNALGAGEVRVLTHPASAGYAQNPISVYYCYSPTGELERCIAEVTNTPWAERVRFNFAPAGQDVPKALHVSPLMDMKSTWWGFVLVCSTERRTCKLHGLAVGPSSSQVARWFNVLRLVRWPGT
jgi:Protein of unknown function (DUF1365)